MLSMPPLTGHSESAAARTSTKAGITIRHEKIKTGKRKDLLRAFVSPWPRLSWRIVRPILLGKARHVGGDGQPRSAATSPDIGVAAVSVAAVDGRVAGRCVNDCDVAKQPDSDIVGRE